jgi:hypothetical protein
MYGTAMVPSSLEMASHMCHTDAMNLHQYVETLTHQLEVAAEAGGAETRLVAERLIPTLDAAIRLTLQDVLAAAAEEITCELAPGSVEVRLRGRDPEFVVTPPLDRSRDDLAHGAGSPAPINWAPPDIARSIPPAEGEEAAMARINFRMPDHLKARIERAAESEGLSVNAWLVRVTSAALEHPSPDPRRDQGRPSRGQRFTGWVR